MRKFEQKQLLELINTMKTAVGMMEKIYGAGEWNAFLDLLAGQQEAAISIGTRLENYVARDADRVSEEVTDQTKETVQLLELYCELLWNISNVEGQTQLAEPIATLAEALVQIEKNIQEMPVRLEVVFLPYKASMWDCMETVWEAANEDMDCEVYVVPIPYFDLQPDGSAGAMHYEGALMPKKVPVTDYRKYKIEERRPDIIYIHNPYDEYNKVTSVHPDYYSSKLQNYTDMLVYIPYFLIGEHLAETHSLLPAYVYADKIILNAETMMEDIDSSIPRDKFIIAGSTKIERLVWMGQHKDELDIPVDWKRKMEGKKVVFYNLSISGLLKHREKMLAKMEEVFGVFEKREDVVMLYRPHPLVESTLTSMCPELLEGYQRLIKRVKKMKNAIYDTTPDSSVAVALSDAYVGEVSSSMVDMFKALDKPVFFMTEKMYYQPTVDEMMSDKTFDVCKVGDDLWFITNKSQLLCKYNMKNDELECVAEIPETTRLGQYREILNYDDQLILVPVRAGALCIYNISSNTFRKDYFREENVLFKFGGGTYRHGHYLYLVPIHYPAIVRYDMQTGEFRYYADGVKEAYKRMDNGEEIPHFTGSTAWEDIIYVVSDVCNRVLCFNMCTEEYRICTVGEETDRYYSILADHDGCWLAKLSSPAITRWNPETGEATEYEGIPNGYEYGERPYRDILSTKDRIYLLSGEANRSLQMLKSTGEIVYTDFILSYNEGSLKSEYYKLGKGINHTFGKWLSKNEIVVCSCYDDSLVILNVNDKTCKIIPIRLQEQIKAIAKKNGGSLKEKQEYGFVPLSRYLEYVVQELLEANVPIGQPKVKMESCIGAGKKVYEQVKSALCK